MPSSLFPAAQNNASNNNILDAISRVKSAMQGNPQALFNDMMQNNPKFRQFAQSVQGKTPEEAFSQYGLDFNKIKGMMK